MTTTAWTPRKKWLATPKRSALSELHRITVDPQQSGGSSRLRNLRIRVKDVLHHLAAGAGREEILEDEPFLEPGDTTAAHEYAARQMIIRRGAVPDAIPRQRAVTIRIDKVAYRPWTRSSARPRQAHGVRKLMAQFGSAIFHCGNRTAPVSCTE